MKRNTPLPVFGIVSSYAPSRKKPEGHRREGAMCRYVRWRSPLFDEVHGATHELAQCLALQQTVLQ